MGILTTDMKRVVEEQRLGFVATVCPDGSPNLSPKGTTAIWDDDHLAFANIASPRTIANLRHNPSVEVNVVDQFVRKGYRFKGVASILESGASYDKALAFYRTRGVQSTIREIVLIRVQSASPVISPAYDFGATEDEVRAHWERHFGVASHQKADVTTAPVNPESHDLRFTARERSVEDALESLKLELERLGEENDAVVTDRSRRMLNITRDTGEFLAVLVRAAAARRVLEIGTSNGYSTLWLADAASQIGGFVTTVEFAEQKVRLATANFNRSGLSQFIELLHDDAGRFLQRSEASAYDLIFLDSERLDYPSWWRDLSRILRPGGLLIVDNATSPPQAAVEMVPFIALVKADAEYSTCLVPVGKGEFVAVKMSPSVRQVSP